MREEIEWKEFRIGNSECLAAAAIAISARDIQVLIVDEIHEIMGVAYITPEDKVRSWKMPPDRHKKKVEAKLIDLFAS